MPGIDATKNFVVLRIAVLTVSDTRAIDDDKSGATLAERIAKPPAHAGRRAQHRHRRRRARSARRVKAWIADPVIDVIITTGGTGFTGRDVTPEAVEPLFEKKMDGFSALFLMISFPQDRHLGDPVPRHRRRRRLDLYLLPARLARRLQDAWDEILVHQLDYRYGPCNFVEIMPRLDEHLRRAKAQGATL